MGERRSSHRVPSSIPSFPHSPAHAAKCVIMSRCEQGEAGWACGNGLFHGGVKGAALRFPPEAFACVVRSSRHEMLESIPPWMAAGFTYYTQHTRISLFVEYS